MRLLSNIFKIARSRFIFWFLERYTAPDMVQLTTHGTWKIFEGDIAVINGRDFINVGVVNGFDIGPKDEIQQVRIRLFRRPR